MKKYVYATAVSSLVFWLVLLLFAQRYMGNFEDIPLAFKPDRGASVLPAAIREMADITRARGLKTYTLSRSLSDDIAFYQRSVEYLYPVRITAQGPFMFATADEGIPSTCQLIQRGTSIDLYECSH